MNSYKVKDLKKIKWIRDSDFCKALDDSDDIIFIPKQIKLFSDVLTNAKLEEVISSVIFFGGEPKNFLDYIRNLKPHEFQKVLLDFDQKSGEYKFISKLRDFNSISSTELSEWATKNGYLDFLKYAIKHEFYFRDDLIDVAAINGHLNCLKYLHEKRFKWGKETTSYAAYNRNLDCFHYAKNNGCPYDDSTSIYVDIVEGNSKFTWSDFNFLRSQENSHLELLNSSVNWNDF